MTTKTFKETQRFNQGWIILLLTMIILISLMPILLMFQQPQSSSTDWRIIALSFGIVLLVCLLILNIKLKTEIDKQGIHYQFGPLTKKTILWQDIEQCYVRSYSPIREFGGWGIRFGFNGRAFNVKGNQGIQLVLKSGKKILIGTQKSEEAQQIIHAHKPNLTL